jgi:hypothetical protein
MKGQERELDRPPGEETLPTLSYEKAHAYVRKYFYPG